MLGALVVILLSLTMVKIANLPQIGADCDGQPMKAWWKRLNANQRTAVAMVGVVLTMGSAAWAAIPFYSWFCRVTGYAGATVTAEANARRSLIAKSRLPLTPMSIPACLGSSSPRFRA